MAGQSFLLQLGARLATLGTAASLAIAFPADPAVPYAMTSHTAANRTGLYGTIAAGTESINFVTGGVDGARFHTSGTLTQLTLTGAVSARNVLTAWTTSDAASGTGCDFTRVGNSTTDGGHNIRGIDGIVRGEITIAKTNSGSWAGGWFQCLRNITGLNDSGTLTNLYGNNISFGHYSTAVVTPTTTNVSGVNLTQNMAVGTVVTYKGVNLAAITAAAGTTITTYVGVDIGAVTAAGTITTAYGLRIGNIGGGTKYSISTGTGIVSIGDATDATTPTAAGMTVVGGIGAGRIRTTSDSYFNDVRVGKGNNSLANNVVVGDGAGGTLVAGSVRNTAIGSNALAGSIVIQTDNVSVGYNAMVAGCSLAGDGQNVAVGSGALQSASRYRNVAIGHQALSLCTAQENTGLGARAGNALTTGSTCTFVGMDADTTLVNAVNSTALGASATLSASNQIVFGNTAVTDITSQPSACWHPTAGAAASASAMSFGVALTEGLQIKVIEETVSFAVAAKFKPLTTAIPAGAQMIGAECNVQTLVVAGGTSTGIALGQNGGTVNKYGFVNTLTQNSKITTPTDWIVNAGEQIDVCITVAGGAALGDTNANAGTVRVRIYYFQLNALANA